VNSPFGQVSDELLFGELNGQQMVFLQRHGRGHKIPLSTINMPIASGSDIPIEERYPDELRRFLNYH
jgi:hypothetical protein